ncbi:hypothetical protein CEXT_22451 [Caerostris extrusa]|uniref:Uncharacterized protein n=1 Tax=Caerostris extrusa TaxID=172846 RepID=A0AAV4VJX6_CAEEX|nr:hypothetical protein CEXT_22451 [Caerostris extrusa]
MVGRASSVRSRLLRPKSLSADGELLANLSFCFSRLRSESSRLTNNSPAAATSVRKILVTELEKWNRFFKGIWDTGVSSQNDYHYRCSIKVNGHCECAALGEMLFCTFYSSGKWIIILGIIHLRIVREALAPKSRTSPRSFAFFYGSSESKESS